MAGSISAKVVVTVYMVKNRIGMHQPRKRAKIDGNKFGYQYLPFFESAKRFWNPVRKLKEVLFFPRKNSKP